MARIIQFPLRIRDMDEDPEIDLLTAVDAAIRDLRDIAEQCVDANARLQAEECRKMLERAYEATV